MRGRILGNYGNKYETFVADTGSPISIVPVNVAKKNGLKWWALDEDEPNYSGITGSQLNILGQATITVKFTTIKMAASIPVLICREEGEECIIDLDALKEMGVVHKDTLTNWYLKVPCVRKISPQPKLGSV